MWTKTRQRLYSSLQKDPWWNWKCAPIMLRKRNVCEPTKILFQAPLHSIVWVLGTHLGAGVFFSLFFQGRTCFVMILGVWLKQKYAANAVDGCKNAVNLVNLLLLVKMFISITYSGLSGIFGVNSVIQCVPDFQAHTEMHLFSTHIEWSERNRC